MRSLEIPYNFDKKLIDVLKILNESGENYSSIYCCPYKDDYKAAKRNHSNPEGLDMLYSNEMDRTEYISHIQYIEKNFPGKLMLLLQQTDIVMDREILNFYLALGFTRFCVGNLEQAKQLKEINSDFFIIGSIAMKASIAMIESEEYQKYLDGFVLFFPFNRNLKAIKNLPKNKKYILLVNCDCNIHCSGTQHWFASREDELLRTYECPNKFYGPERADWAQIIRIRPMDAQIFDPYIYSYKLQGREYNTGSIIKDVCLWTYNYSRYPGIIYSEDLYQTN